jgi:hypothetical protein
MVMGLALKTTVAIAVLLCGCVRAIEPESPRLAGSVSVPPVSNFLPWDEQAGPFLVFEMGLSKSEVRFIQGGHLTAVVRFTDCFGNHLQTSDMYVGGESLYQSHLSEVDFGRLIEPMSEPIVVAAYIRRSIYEASESVCAEPEAGAVLTGISIEQIKLK